ncbi:hypothetical protein I551_8910 [Mycobacterium ulcerans str. Harvey]|uniref:Uncharacterized protein n=1 Tax=Mycobacterium ulcerans str. Harvey TaxID=1299332 RepID=A0ABN0R9L2_MYCUL|nr:hypothetical protein I551_8910 [Mycobacterium ulcerans str. Harvey]
MADRIRRTATVLVSPTTNREATKAALDKLQFADRTAPGKRSSRPCRPSPPSER